MISLNNLEENQQVAIPENQYAKIHHFWLKFKLDCSLGKEIKAQRYNGVTA
jgi:hypothetical protein